MQITLGFSPCPNDTFIFDAIVNKRIDLEGLEFEIILEDVEKLNQLAFQNTLDVTKLSYHALALLMPDYQLLHAGSALGNNCGPLLISSKEIDLENKPSTKLKAILDKNKFDINNKNHLSIAKEFLITIKS